MRLTPGREAVLAGLAVLLLHLSLRLAVAPGAFQDDAIYLALGRALADGEGWRSIYAAGAPVHLKYPPGLPLLYAAAWFLGGSLEATLLLVHALHLLTAAALGGLLWWTARVRFGLPPAAAVIAVLPLGLVSLVDHLQLPIAEGPFLAAWTGALALALAPLTARRAVALGALLAAAILLRSQGWAVLAGVAAGLFLAGRDRRLTLIAVAAALVPVVLWTGLHGMWAARGPLSAQPDEAGYLAWLGSVAAADLPGTLLRAAWANVAAYWSIIPRELGPAGPGHVVAVAGLLLAILASVRGGRRLLPLSLSVGLSLLLLLLWPFTQARFVLALLPMAALLAAVGAGALRPRLPQAALGVAVLVVAAALGLRQTGIRRAAHAPDPRAAVGFVPIGHTLLGNTRWVRTLAPWVTAETDEGDRILTEGAAGLWLLTGRAGVAALPVTPNVAVRRADEPAGRYVSGRIVADSITWVIASSTPVMAEVAAVEQACAGTFRRGVAVGPVAIAFAVRDSTRSCLTALAR